MNETGEEALIRELREELAIEPMSTKEFFRQDWVYPDSATDLEMDGSFRVYYFLVNKFQGSPVNRTFEDIRWVTPAELQTMDILEGNKASVELLTKYAEQKQTT